MPIDLSALVIVDTALRRSAVSGFIGKDRVVSAELAASDMLVHTSVQVIAHAYVNGCFGFGIEDTVFALRAGDLTRVVGVKRADLGRSAGFVKSHTCPSFPQRKNIQ